MNRGLLRSLCLLGVVMVAACSSGGGAANDQERFGVRMARMSLWREALFRFQRAVAIDPADAMLHNNLAVAYEANGDFENAARAYREAMRLDKSNQYIQKNYSRFVEFNSRNRKRQRPAPDTKATEAAAETAAPSTPATVGDTRSQPASPPEAPVVPEAAAPAATPPTAPPAAPEGVPPSPQPPPENPPGGDL